MIAGDNKRGYVVLAIKMTLAVYIVGHGLIFIHEMSHGCTALALGGYFPFLQIDAEGGRSIFLFPLGTPAWKEALVMLAGSLANTLVSMLALGLLASGIKGREKRFLIILTGGLSGLLLVIGSGLMPPWWPRYKEVGEALFLLGLSPLAQHVLKVLWVLIGSLFVLGFFRLFFRELAEFFPAKSYRSRFSLVTAALAAPVIGIMIVLSVVMLAAGYGEGVITISRHMPHIVFLLLIWILLPFGIGSRSSQDQGGTFRVSRPQLLGYSLVALAFAAAQPFVFGNDRANPSGHFFGSPPEVQVSACNIGLAIREDSTARVRLLMRPFAPQHEFLWNRVKQREPADWKYYDEFALANLPVLLGTSDVKLAGHYADPEAPFFTGSWDKGARVVEVDVDLSRSLQFDGSKPNRVLKLVDFWRRRQIGYIDFTEVKVEGALQITGVAVEPAGASPPSLRSRNAVRWENRNLGGSFESGFVAFNQPASLGETNAKR